MATIDYNEVKERRYIVLDGAPYEVLTSHVFRKQQRKPVNDTKLRNLFTGKVLEHSFHQSDKVDRAKRFELPADLVSTQMNFVKPNTTISLLSFQEKPMGVKTAIKVELKVKEAAPAVK